MAITFQEKTNIQTSEIQQLIDRLKAEKKLMLNQVQQQGFKLGVKSAPNISFVEFQRIECLNTIGISFNEESLIDIWHLLDAREFDRNVKLGESGLYSLLCLNEENKGAFAKGWIEGVLSVWKHIKNLLSYENLS